MCVPTKWEELPLARVCGVRWRLLFYKLNMNTNMKTKLMAVTVAVIGCAVGIWAAAPELVPGKWGSDVMEQYRDLPGKGLTGLIISRVGGIDGAPTTYRETSWSPWTGDGPPDDDYVVSQGRVIMWWGTGPDEHMGYYWKRTADKKISKTDYITENILVNSWPVSYFWGYMHEDPGYKRIGGCHFGVQNRTSKVQSVTVDVEWWPNRHFDGHWTSHKFTIQPTETGYAIPQPQTGEFGWIADNIETIEEAR